jgi:hypothetical protein
MLGWLRSKGFKNTFTAASHPHTRISSELSHLILTLTARTEDPESVNLVSYRSGFYIATHRLPSLSEAGQDRRGMPSLESQSAAACSTRYFSAGIGQRYSASVRDLSRLFRPGQNLHVEQSTGPRLCFKLCLIFVITVLPECFVRTRLVSLCSLEIC